jgi:hypothetical protein
VQAKFCFLLPEDARDIALLEAVSDPRHKCDLWQYWSAHPFFTNESWKWKLEFHYLNKVEIDDFAAILWPISKPKDAHLSMRSGLTPNTKLNSDAEIFKKLHPNCKVIEYNYGDTDNFDRELLKASTLAMKYFADEGKFPNSVTIKN